MDGRAAKEALTGERSSPIRARLLADGVAQGFPADVHERRLEARADTLMDVRAELDGELVAIASDAARCLT